MFGKLVDINPAKCDMAVENIGGLRSDTLIQGVSRCSAIATLASLQTTHPEGEQSVLAQKQACFGLSTCSTVSTTDEHNELYVMCCENT